ncbi:MAG: molybdopterin-dependent oxidoreductase [Sphaerospermopsis sp. SIO1G2]|nr:molybdopterin-dependent oxidoreductase [Sphaerospermopsis sp. SIO1G1]NET73772.1 molybdopterin-dependent oxidoreductase [Sphaerospermopsis sp. SIO1G2]
MVAVNTCKNLVLVSLKVAIFCLVGCTNQPTDQQLEVWLKEAGDRNAEILAKQAKNIQQSQWNLVIQGQTETGKTVTLNWSQLQDLATVNINTVDANYIVNPNKLFTFTGIPVSDLLQEFMADKNITEITFVCYDAYQVTIKTEDLLKYPIILAIARDGQAISRSDGGPIYLIFPYTQYPETKQKYDDGMWAFYVTHMILGTETGKLSVNNQEINISKLDELQQVTIKEEVAYGARWPSDKIELHGVRLKDVLSLASIKMQPNQSVFVRGKPEIYQKSSDEQTLPFDILQKCDVILATRWGKDKQPIPASLGGPITLAISKKCPAETEKVKWVTFVEGLTVK